MRFSNHLFGAALLLTLVACPTSSGGGPPGGAQSGALRFTFSGLPAGVGAALRVTGPGFTRDLTAEATIPGLAPGTYNAQEGAVAGYRLHDIACASNPNGGIGGDDNTVDAATGAATIGLQALETVSCAFNFQAAPSTGSSVPTAPVLFARNTPFRVNSGTLNYVDVPDAYDATHQTPMTLLVWLHGCGGYSSGDIYTVSPGGAQSWISLAVGGQEGNCWDMNADPPRVMAAIADIKTHFNIKPHGVILGGYSSGGDLSYRTAFYNAYFFAGILVENTSPFQDTGSTQAASLAAAAWKFNVAHLAHLQDGAYPIDGVRAETDALKAAGFPVTRIEVDGGHYDAPGATENGHPVPGTNADLAADLFPYLNAGWTSP